MGLILWIDPYALLASAEGQTLHNNHTSGNLWKDSMMELGYHSMQIHLPMGLHMSPEMRICIF